MRVVRVNARQVDEAQFRQVADAVLKRRLLAFRYDGRDGGSLSERLVSPQRLTHYRDNWYLEAFDEGANGMRTFAVERISAARLQPGRRAIFRRRNWTRCAAAGDQQGASRDT